jgi:hypothetical protein
VPGANESEITIGAKTTVLCISELGQASAFSDGRRRLFFGHLRLRGGEARELLYRSVPGRFGLCKSERASRKGGAAARPRTGTAAVALVNAVCRAVGAAVGCSRHFAASCSPDRLYCRRAAPFAFYARGRRGWFGAASKP